MDDTSCVHNERWGLSCQQQLPPSQCGTGGRKTDEDENKPWRTQEKPLALIQEVITRFSPVSSLVVDLFAGTFSTALAACKLGRRFVGGEIDVELLEAAKGRVQVAYDTLEGSLKSKGKGGKIVGSVDQNRDKEKI